jgi:hypothetical protein
MEVKHMYVMDVIGLYASLGSSRVQLHNSLDSTRHAHVQKLVSVVKMATVLKVCTTEDHRSVVRFFFVAKGLEAKDIHKEMFLFMMGSVYRVKRFTTGSRNSLKECLKVADDARPGRSVETATEAPV